MVPVELTLAMVKPDAVGAGQAGWILHRLEREGFVLRGARLVRLDRQTAAEFYHVHRGKPFFEPLLAFMTSGPVLALALERENAVEHLRKVIGATDPREASPGTIRAEVASSKERNAIHASDSAETAAREVAFFFSRWELEGARRRGLTPGSRRGIN